jgi:hypothetical protein
MDLFGRPMDLYPAEVMLVRNGVPSDQNGMKLLIMTLTIDHNKPMLLSVTSSTHLLLTYLFIVDLHGAHLAGVVENNCRL